MVMKMTRGLSGSQATSVHKHLSERSSLLQARVRRPRLSRSVLKIGVLRREEEVGRGLQNVTRASGQSESGGDDRPSPDVSSKVDVQELESTLKTTLESLNTPELGDVNKDMESMARKIAGTYAPRSSTAKKNPAVKGSLLYTIFEAQAVLSIVVGGLLAYNVIFPSEGPTIARMLGMWSVWMLAVPSLRARDCSSEEKDALNLLFVAIPLLNVLLPLLWRSFAGVFTADVLMMGGVYWWKFLGSPEEEGS
mmetsp:Transcript_3739/g.9430  ORF Transcript_3739/g.9430 Transcript_3739/m.9430 type:complete len:251 (-) Transcript_3739:90-842(-)